jgi:hypothetical protein
MKITFDTTKKIVGLGVVPWTRLGLEHWFDDYTILSLQGCDLDGWATNPRLKTLGSSLQGKKNVQNMVQTQAFTDRVKSEMASAYFLPYKPITIENGELAKRFLMNDPQFTRTYENKAYFRKQFAATIPFAPYKIYADGMLGATKVSYEKIVRKFGHAFVLQHEQLSGGKGTRIIESFDDFKKAMLVLPKGKIVVSQLITDAVERSVQVVATRNGIFTGALQKQIVRNPQLYKADLNGASTFCGGEVGTVRVSQAVEEKVQAYAEVIGQHMYVQGYRGIFGMDMLIRGEEVFVLEVNARITGLTPLLMALYREGNIPFYLLHALELGNFDYRITEFATEPIRAGGLLLLQAHNDEPMQLTKTLDSGIYAYENGQLTFIRKDLSFKPSDDDLRLLIQAYVPKGSIVKPGERVVAVFTQRPILDETEELQNEYTKLVNELYARIAYKPLAKAMKTEIQMNVAGTGSPRVGAVELVSFPEYDMTNVEAKTDTGAASMVIHATKIQEKVDASGSKSLQFSPFDHPEKNVTVEKYHKKRVRSSNGQDEVRYFIRTVMVLEGKQYKITASLTDRSNMTYPVLIGNKFLKDNKILVDLNKVAE